MSQFTYTVDDPARALDFSASQSRGRIFRGAELGATSANPRGEDEDQLENINVSLFWFLAGMLTMIAALIVVLPWLRTIPRFNFLPELPWQAPLISLAMAGAALAMYHWLGSPQSIVPSVTATPPSAAMAGGNKATTAGSMSAAVDSLRARLASGAGSADDWELLAKSYEFMGQPDAARQARARQMPPKADGAPAASMAPTAAAKTLSPDSVKLLSKAALLRRDKKYAAAAEIYKQLAVAGQMNADAWADYADTAATLQGDKLAGEPETYLANALALDAQHPKALWLKASADEEAGRYGAAIAVWQQLAQVLPAQSQDAKIVNSNLQRDQEALGSAVSGDVSSATGGTRISGEVSLSSKLSSKAEPGATLFIVAKSVDAPGPPVAVYRGRVSDWPVKFTLDDSSSMLPGRNLSNAKHITVEARISRSGQAQPTAGDLRGVTGVLDPSSREPLKIVIDEEIS